MAGTQRIEALREKESLGFDVAWISRGGVLKYALSPWARQDPQRASHSGLNSSVVQLIEGVYASEPRWSLAWIRNRIWTTESWGVASSATVKVAARRVGWEAKWAVFYAEIQAVGASRAQELEPLPGAAETDPALELVPVWASCRARGKTGELFLKRSNRAKTLRTRHAEVELLRAFYAQRDGVSEEIEIEVSLKCCKMCAAWIFEAFAGKLPFRVLYREYDPGRLAQFTALEASTPQRRQAVAALGLEASWITRELESFWVGPSEISR
jgi:hypothetical protein